MRVYRCRHCCHRCLLSPTVTRYRPIRVLHAARGATAPLLSRQQAAVLMAIPVRCPPMAHGVIVGLPLFSQPPPRRVRFGEKPALLKMIKIDTLGAKHKSLTPHMARTVSAMLCPGNYGPQLPPVHRHCHHHHYHHHHHSSLPGYSWRILPTQLAVCENSRWTCMRAECGAR